MNNDQYLKIVTLYGLEKMGKAENQEYLDRLDEEVETIIECGLSDFLLITSLIVLSLKSKVSVEVF